jgi:hypothetical protein
MKLINLKTTEIKDKIHPPIFPHANRNGETGSVNEENVKAAAADFLWDR